MKNRGQEPVVQCGKHAESWNEQRSGREGSGYGEFEWSMLNGNAMTHAHRFCILTPDHVVVGVLGLPGRRYQGSCPWRVVRGFLHEGAISPKNEVRPGPNAGEKNDI